MKPLSGLKILDLTTLLPGPLATLILAEAGADVVKIEPPDGDNMRRMAPLRDGVSALFSMLNRGKRAITLDLKSGDGRASLDTLIREADILVEQFRPGVLARLGLDADRLSDLNPRLIVCSITGYGQSGPKADLPGHDLNYQAESGLLSLSPGAGDTPTVPPALIADIAGGSFPAVINILLALRHRDRTGKGCHIDIAMTDALFTLALCGLAQLDAGGRAPRPGGELLTGGSPRYRLYPTSDGGLVAVGALEEKFWRVFCGLIDLPADLVDDQADVAATTREVARLIADRPASHWQRVFKGQEACANVVRSLDDALRDPHFAGRGLFDRKTGLGDGTRAMALPMPIAEAFRAQATDAPTPVVAEKPDGIIKAWPKARSDADAQ